MLRAVTHLDITDDDIDRAIEVVPGALGIAVSGLVLQAVLFDWGETLSPLRVGRRAARGRPRGGARGDRARGGGRGVHGPVRRRAAAGAARGGRCGGSLDYEAELREALGGVSDDELDRFLDAEHDAWRPARALVDAGHALLETLRGRGLRLAIVANTWPEPARLVRRELEELGVAERVDRIVLSGEVGVRKPARAIFELALAQLGLDPLEVLFVGDRLGRRHRGRGGRRA